ncbi:hypothetical protein IE53DRAFT_339438 [Violaceomyces palustris]|uniref:Uncharacterized protein n=1 Tax=Violaceomyces palustris TaxID=1673888 RepID=A0ACD0P4W4_9BASI|nr:hypothetical protein IE53DRAFT_339438 [Violaceomyces palustris]
MVFSTAVFSLLSLALLLPAKADAKCACGYRDPYTNSLWTDATLTYFNETEAAADIVFQPASSASLQGSASAGDSGTGNQSWAAGQDLNPWEQAFSALWRSGVSYNNTQLDPDSDRGLALAVQPADTKHRISYGSRLTTRRRDILYGSFRASMAPASPYQGGTILQMSATFNDSDVVETSIYTKDDPTNAAYTWSYSARDQISDPVSHPLATLGNDPYGFHEHRFDWLPNELQFANDAPVVPANSLDLRRKDNGINIPSLPSPFSFKHWANGARDGSQGPPIHHQPTANILYARLFFNSSLSERNAEFEQQCQQAGGDDFCDTEDFTLRGSTPFSLVAIEKQEIPKSHKEIPLYAVVAESASGGLFIVILAHALTKRYLKAKRKERTLRAFLAAGEREKDPNAEGQHGGITPSLSSSSRQSISRSLDSDETRAEIEKAMAIWNNPALIGGEEDEQDEYEAGFESDSDDEDDPLRIKRRTKTEDLDSFGHGSFSHGQLLTTLKYTPPQYRLYSPSPSEQTHGGPPLSGHVRSHFAETSSSSLGHGHSASAEGDDEEEIIEENAQRPRNHRRSSRQSEAGINSAVRPPFRTMRMLTSESGHSRGIGGIGAPASDSGHDMYRNDPTDSRQDSSSVSHSGIDHSVRWNVRIIEWVPKEESGNGKEAEKDSVARLAVPRANTPEVPRPVGMKRKGLLQRITKKLFVAEGEAKATASGAARVEYLDGLRGFACFLVSFHHFMLIFYYGIADESAANHYPAFETWFRFILGPILVNGGLNVGIFFVLSARVIANRYLVRGKLQDLAEATHRRVPRLAVPISAGILMCYFLIEADAFHWIQRANSRTWSPWSYFQDYNNLGTFFNSYILLWFTVPPQIPLMVTTYATGILWTAPVIVQSSWTVFTCALIAREFNSARKRYSFYTLCFLASWLAGRFDYFFIAGLMIADADNKLKYRALAAKGIRIGKFRMHGQVLAWIVFLAGAVMSWIEFSNVDLDFTALEHGIHPDFVTSKPKVWVGRAYPNYTDPRLYDFWFVIGFFLLCDLCVSFRTFFQLRFWSVFGRNAFSLYLLHGVVMWTVSASVTLKLLVIGVPYWAAILINFLVTYVTLFLLCEAFTRTFDTWGIGLSKSFWRLTTGGIGRRL